MLDQARGANATIVRTLVDWSKTAPTRPANAANPFDPAYRFSDIDELVRNAQQRGLEVIITIWGTPKWANGGKTPNNVPTNVNDLQNFSRAVAARYSGRYAQYPFVGRYSVWNESNLQLFLSPQFDAKGRSVGPRLYAKMYAAAYAGIKAGNARAQVAIGSTSSHGRDKKLNGKSDTHSPGRFAQLVAAANPRLKFAAWAQHPYPTPQYLKPTQKVKWPNVTLTSLPRFEQSLDKWFKRKGVRIWITEYGHETKPDGEPKGVSRAQQAAYTTRRSGSRRRIRASTCSSGSSSATTRRASGRAACRRGAARRSPRSPASARAAKSVDARNPLVKVRGGILAAGRGAAARAGANLAPATRSGSTSASSCAASSRDRPAGDAARPGRDARFRLTGFKPAKKTTYVVRLDANTANGGARLARADDRRQRSTARRTQAPALIPRSTIAG